MTGTQTKKTKKAIALIILTFFVCVLFIKFPAQTTSWSLLPPMLAIFIAFVSGRLSLSLGSAVLLGAFISHYGTSQSILHSSFKAIIISGNYVFDAGTNKGNLQILGFVFFILSMVHIMTISGGLHALVRSLQRFIVGPRSAQFVTAVLGCLIFIDDYANTMIVGTTMKKVTDKYKISREKLAFLVDATSAPIAGIALVSTWIGYEVGLFSDMSKKFQWPVDGYGVFLDAIQFRFYCVLMLVFVFTNVFFGIDFGPMKEKALSPIIDEEPEEKNEQGFLANALVPLFTLLSLVFILLWRDGGGFLGKNPLSLTHWREVLTASENGIWILFVSSLASYGVALLLAFSLARVPLQKIFKGITDGIRSAWLPIVILLLAWSLKLVCDDLKTGEYIVQALSDQVQAHWLPMAIFIVAALTAFSTGTSWGTMAILIPTVTPLAVHVSGGEYGVFVSLCLAAILDGAIMGDHCSPISDTTIMSSISTDCDLLSHVRTQLPYSLIVGTIALLVCYLPMGLGWPLSTSLILSLFLIVGLFFVLSKWTRKRRGAL